MIKSGKNSLMLDNYILLEYEFRRFNYSYTNLSNHNTNILSIYVDRKLRFFVRKLVFLVLLFLTNHFPIRRTNTLNVMKQFNIKNTLIVRRNEYTKIVNMVHSILKYILGRGSFRTPFQKC